jgi:hypothetical protein
MNINATRRKSEKTPDNEPSSHPSAEVVPYNIRVEDHIKPSRLVRPYHVDDIS